MDHKTFDLKNMGLKIMDFKITDIENLKFKNEHLQNSGPKPTEEHFFSMILDINILEIINYLNN